MRIPSKIKILDKRPIYWTLCTNGLRFDSKKRRNENNVKSYFLSLVTISFEGFISCNVVKILDCKYRTNTSHFFIFLWPLKKNIKNLKNQNKDNKISHGKGNSLRNKKWGAGWAPPTFFWELILKFLKILRI